MALRLSALASLSLVATVALGGCSAVDSLGIGSGDEVEDVAPTSTDVVEEAASPEIEATEPEPTASELAPPACEDLFSPSQVAALVDQERVSIGDTSEGVVGYGTTQSDLVSVLSATRADVRISCTWYLPASESVSVTSMAILGSDAATTVAGVLTSLESNRSTLSGATLWDIEQAASGESPDFIATESHLLVEAPCPSSLAEESCSVWITTNYTFGDASPLTRDAATHLGLLGG